LKIQPVGICHGRKRGREEGKEEEGSQGWYKWDGYNFFLNTYIDVRKERADFFFFWQYWGLNSGPIP
jgi:hypothetical protein